MRCRGLILVLWLGLCSISPVLAAAADAMLSEVSAALAAGKYEDAVTVAGSGLSEPGLSDLTRARLLVVRGLSRQALGNNDDALADFTQALSIAALAHQERAKAVFARGVTLDSLNRLDDAAGDYGAALRLAPGAPFALNNRANVYRRQNRLEDARHDYLAALNGTNPNPQYPYFGLGQIAEAQGHLDAARGYYNKALAAAPSFVLARERLAALGAPVEGPLGLPADTGIIVLKPPGPATAAVTLIPPEPEAPAVPPAPARGGTLAKRGGVARVSAVRGTSLRPTIVEGTAASLGQGIAQLGAWRSEQEARNGWDIAQDNAGGLLDGLTPVILRAEIPGRGVFYRLRTKPSEPIARFCATLAGKGLSCIPTRD